MWRWLRRSLLHEFSEASAIYPSHVETTNREQARHPLPALIGTDESQPIIPWRVGLQRSPEDVKKLNIFAQGSLFRDMFGHDLFRSDPLAAIEDNQSSANAIADSRC